MFAHFKKVSSKPTNLVTLRFNRKRLTAKDEVKRIMLDLCLKLGKDDDNLAYSKDIKQIFYLGCKILYEFVRYPPKHVLSLFV